MTCRVSTFDLLHRNHWESTLLEQGVIENLRRGGRTKVSLVGLNLSNFRDLRTLAGD